jgi:hypothetical protein
MTPETNLQQRLNAELVAKESDNKFNEKISVIKLRPETMDRCGECGLLVPSFETKRNAGACDRCAEGLI